MYLLFLILQMYLQDFLVRHIEFTAELQVMIPTMILKQILLLGDATECFRSLNCPRTRVYDWMIGEV